MPENAVNRDLKIVDDELTAGRASEADQHADEYQRRIKEQQTRQFQLLKDEARALYGMLDGRPGIRSLADIQKLLAKAGDEIGNGRFVVRCLGAERVSPAAASPETFPSFPTFPELLPSERPPRGKWGKWGMF
jgi:hypothetical protein